MSAYKKLLHSTTPRYLVLCIDLILSTVSFILASFIINALKAPDLFIVDFIYPLGIVLLVRFIGYLATRSYTGILKYISTPDAVRVFFAVSISTIALLAIDGVGYISNGKHFIKPSVLVIDAFILVFFLSGFRIAFKILYNQYINKTTSNQVIIFGAGEAGLIVKRSFERNAKHGKKVVAFLDDDPKMQGNLLEGVQIHSPSVNLNKLIDPNAPAELVIAIGQISPLRKKKMIEDCLYYNIPVKTIPPMSAWIDGEFNPKNVDSVKIEDLLERDPIKLDIQKINKELTNETIMITGAAGSIGSEIVRQCLKFNPKLVILVDQGETPLYEIENELNGTSKTNIEIVVADVRNLARMERIFNYFKPTYVFHAAAYKHVPLMEDNPYEAINTNVFGTQTIATLAVKYNTKKFVFVSTDKAVNPTNIMGASKRIAEIYVQSLNAKLSLESDSHTKFVTTRFGNVLGSNGSVIPLFTKQIREGGPITVTHPEITRYFMTIPEACQLVLEAGVMGQGGEIYIFDMGQSVKIIDLAKKMIRLSGLEEGTDIDIKFTGLRPGEKLKEELLNDKENTIGTHNRKIMIAKVPEYNYLKVNALISDLYKQKDDLKNKVLVKTMKEIVPEYRSNNSIYEELDSNILKM